MLIRADGRFEAVHAAPNMQIGLHVRGFICMFYFTV